MAQKAIQFFVAGLPKPAGSKKAFPHRTTGKIIVTDDSGKAGRLWRAEVKRAAAHNYRDEPLMGAVSLWVIFYLPRPKSHYRTGRNCHILRDNAPKSPIVKPDALKLARSVEDSLTSVIYKDDAQVVFQIAKKAYCDEAHPQPGVSVRVQNLEGK